MKTIELDFSGCENVFDLQERIRRAFDFPEWYGMSWDAFDDLLCSDCDAEKVIIKGEDLLPDALSEDLLIFHEILERNKQTWINSSCPFDFEIIR